MLSHLHIRNLAVVDEIEVEPQPTEEGLIEIEEDALEVLKEGGVH